MKFVIRLSLKKIIGGPLYLIGKLGSYPGALILGAPTSQASVPLA
jgi:hypothetical protein